MYIRVPHWMGVSRHKDPTHCRDFDPKTFTYFMSDNRWRYGIDKRWKIDKIQNHENEIIECWLKADK